jgi:phage tail P2-like protein
MAYSATPLLDVLPYEGYKSNEIVVGLSAAVNADYYGVATLLQGMPAKLAPSTAPAEYLDYLAYLVGLSGSYWDSQWHVSIKRAMVAAAHTLWRTKGTIGCINQALAIQNIPYELWQTTQLKLPFTMPGTFYSRNLRFFIRLDLAYARTSREWLEAARVLRNYKPATVDGRVCYKGFKLGYSKLGEPLFR